MEAKTEVKALREIQKDFLWHDNKVEIINFKIVKIIKCKKTASKKANFCVK